MSTPKSTPRNPTTSSDPDATPNTGAGAHLHHDFNNTPSSVSSALPNYAPPTYASFSPAHLVTASSAAKRRSTILVHQKSPLLLATPPQITRALAYSHPFLLPLNKLVGLLTWTTGDPWESFLLLVAFWAVVLYGDIVIRLAGPIVTVLALIGGMYARRYSPLSSSGWGEHPSNVGGSSNSKRKGGGSGGSGDHGGAGHARNGSEATSTRHQKTLDEIVETLKVFTTRCNLLMEPMLEMTDFLSTQRTATSATTRPALTTLFVRLLAITPIWIAMTLPPWRLITTRRVALVFGTLVLSWHSRPSRVSRTLLWRSATVRKIAKWVTGLEFEQPNNNATAQNGGPSSPNSSSSNNGTFSKKQHTKSSSAASAITAALKRGRSSNGKDSGVRFTFILYENQRRWVGLGWTSSLFAYERASWTDEQNNVLPARDEFELPEVEDAPARWRWVEGSRWRVDGVPDPEVTDYDSEAGKMGWIYYDNKWQNGRRGLDGWGRWTRRRKWYRDAELVEQTDEDAFNNKNSNGNAGKVKCPTGTDASSPPPQGLPPRSRSTTRESTTGDDSTSGTAVPEPTSTPSSPELERTKTRLAGAGEDDAASTSSSSRSRFRFPTPSLRRRPTGGSMTQQQGNAMKEGSAAAGNSKSSSNDSNSNNSKKPRQRRTSEATSSSNHTSNSAGSGTAVDDDSGFVGSLDPALELEIQGHHKDLGAWGIGDDAMMGFE